MAAFSLTKSGETYDCELNGDVTRNGTRIGQWTTSKDDSNQLVITEDSGAITPFAAGWRFNEFNQLELHNTSGLLYNWHAVSGVIPLYRLESNALQIKPDRSQSFAFLLNGEWSFDEQMDLTIKLGDTASKIDGYLEDDRTRFAYKFTTKQGDIELYQLTFTGSWAGRNNDGDLLMTFNYTRRGQARSFILPKTITFDKSINQLVFDYEKGGKRRRLQFVGELKISPKFQIQYKLDRQVSNGSETVASTTIAVQATYNTGHLDDRLELSFVLMKQDGVTPGTSLVIGGKYQHDLNGAKLRLAFQYTYQKQGGTVVRQEFAFGGQFILGDNLALTWQFAADIATRSFKVTLAAEHFNLGNVNGNFKLVVEGAGGVVKEVHALFGFAF